MQESVLVAASSTFNDPTLALHLCSWIEVQIRCSLIKEAFEATSAAQTLPWFWGEQMFGVEGTLAVKLGEVLLTS